MYKQFSFFICNSPFVYVLMPPLFQILAWNKVPLSEVPLEHVSQMIEQCDMESVTCTVRTGER